jgi:hypothetical protein
VIDPERIHARLVAMSWPLLTSYDLGSRLVPGEGPPGSVAAPEQRRACWSVHVRCGKPDCGQSVLCASNDSGSYLWCVEENLLPPLRAHIAQCHREEGDAWAAS